MNPQHNNHQKMLKCKSTHQQNPNLLSKWIKPNRCKKNFKKLEVKKIKTKMSLIQLYLEKLCINCLRIWRKSCMKKIKSKLIKIVLKRFSKLLKILFWSLVIQKLDHCRRRTNLCRPRFLRINKRSLFWKLLILVLNKMTWLNLENTIFRP